LCGSLPSSILAAALLVSMAAADTPFSEDEFLVALDDLHAPEIGAKKLVAKMKEAHPERKGINAKAVRDVLQVLRGPDGAALVAAARARLPEPEEPKEEPQEDDNLFMTTKKEPAEPTAAPTPGPQPVFDENDAPPAMDEDEDFSSDDEGELAPLDARAA
jgi:hypothetical protein